MERIGEVIHSLRRRKGWTQGQLAYRAKTTPEYISLIERGKRTNPSAEWLIAIAVALDTTPDYILSEADLLPKGDNAPLPPEVQELAEAYRAYPEGPRKRNWTQVILGAATILRNEERERSGANGAGEGIQEGSAEHKPAAR